MPIVNSTVGLPAWDFRDEVLRRLLHRIQSLSLSEDLLIPFIVTNALTN